MLPIIFLKLGQSLVVWGITEGRQAAREVDTFLQGSSALPGPAGVILPRENLIDQILMQNDTTEVETGGA